MKLDANLESELTELVAEEGLELLATELVGSGPRPVLRLVIDGPSFSLGIANPLSFGPDDHQGLDKVYFTQIDDGELALVMNLKKAKGQ